MRALKKKLKVECQTTVQRMRVVATMTSDGANEVPLMNEK